MAGKVDPKLAAGCIDLYEKIYQSDDIATIQNAYTSSISFSVEAIRSILDGKLATDMVSIKLGVYTKEFVETYPEVKAKEGRLTAILYTDSESYGGPPVENPLNLGDMAP